MNGPDGVNVPAQHQALPGDKTVANLVDESYTLTPIGTNVIAKGKVKNIKEAWTEFDKTDNTGHFAPIELPADLVGQKITISGRNGGDRNVKVDADRLLIMRLENLKADTMTIKQGEDTVMTVDFSGVEKE